MIIDPLAAALQGCSLHTLLILTAKTLTRAGFGDVQILDRRSTKQKSRYGGHELRCIASLGSVRMTVVVKVVLDDVRIRMLDELVGTITRTKADLGLIVTPHYVSASKEALQAGYRPAHVQIVDGAAITELMRRSGIAVRTSGEVDYAMLAELEARSPRILKFVREEHEHGK